MLDYKDVLILVELAVIVVLALRNATMVTPAMVQMIFKMLKEFAAKTPTTIDDEIVDVFSKVVTPVVPEKPEIEVKAAMG